MISILKNSLFVIIILVISFLHASAQLSKVKHVIFIGVDGMGAYAVDRPENSTMRMLMKKGAYTLKAQSCLPSSSAINWASHFMGAGPDQHGYTKWNSKTPENPSKTLDEYGMFPTIFYALRKQKPQLTSAVVYEWEGIKYLYENECVNKQMHGNNDVETTDEAINVIEEMKPNFMFIHLNSPDSAGHEVGFSSEEYFTKVKNVDGYIARIIDASKKAGTFKETLFLISADHGGKNKEHGGDTPIERQVPWIWYGKAVKKKGEIKANIMVYETAPTIAWIFGLTPPAPWIGKPFTSAF